MDNLSSNQYVLEEVFAASVTDAFEHMKQIGSLYPLSPFTASLETITHQVFGVGSKWREHRRHLFLRDVMECEVVRCNAPASFSILSSDGAALQAASLFPRRSDCLASSSQGRLSIVTPAYEPCYGLCRLF